MMFPCCLKYNSAACSDATPHFGNLGTRDEGEYNTTIMARTHHSDFQHEIRERQRKISSRIALAGRKAKSDRNIIKSSTIRMNEGASCDFREPHGQNPRVSFERSLSDASAYACLQKLLDIDCLVRAIHDLHCLDSMFPHPCVVSLCRAPRV